MRKAQLLICPILLLFCLPSFAQESARGGSAKQDAPKVIETEDMKLAMKAGKLETAGKYDEALKVYAQAIELKGLLRRSCTTIAACYTFTGQRLPKMDNRELPICNTRSMTSRLPFVSAQPPRKN